MNVERSKIMRISMQPVPVQILENVEYLNCLGSMITKDARCTREIKPRNAMAISRFNRK